MIISVFDRAENIVRKGKIACASNFSFSHNVFKRLLLQTRQMVSLCGNGLKVKTFETNEDRETNDDNWNVFNSSPHNAAF